MTASITITVRGTPAPQGSKRGFAIRKGGAYTGQVAMVESSKDRVRSWRGASLDAVALYRADHGGYPAYPLTGPLEVNMVFLMRRPKSHYRTGRNAHLLRASAPARPVSPPDTSKLVRASEDALTDAGLIHDDALITDLHASKYYCPCSAGELPGAVITITEAT